VFETLVGSAPSALELFWADPVTAWSVVELLELDATTGGNILDAGDESEDDDELVGTV